MRRLLILAALTLSVAAPTAAYAQAEPVVVGAEAPEPRPYGVLEGVTVRPSAAYQALVAAAQAAPPVRYQSVCDTTTTTGPLLWHDGGGRTRQVHSETVCR